MTNLPPDHLEYTMSPGDVAEALQCSRSTVHYLASIGQLPSITRSRGTKAWRFFKPADVASLAEARGVAQPPEGDPNV